MATRVNDGQEVNIDRIMNLTIQVKGPGEVSVDQKLVDSMGFVPTGVINSGEGSYVETFCACTLRFNIPDGTQVAIAEGGEL